jgi:glycosyltransferase involved in cell wall biosynthesis
VKLAVIIPTKDEASQIEAAVKSAAEATLILVVDGDSADDTVECARAAGARIAACPPGRARQLAAGVVEIERLLRAGELGEIDQFDAFLFLHADTRLPAGFTATVEKALSDPGVVGGAFGFRFEGLDNTGTLFQRVSLRAVQWGARLRNKWFGLAYGDQALFIRPRVLAKFGGIPQVSSLEDLDLVLRLQRRGRFVVLPVDIATSARRYLEAGVWRTVASHACLLTGYVLGMDRRELRRESWQDQ